MSIIKPKKKTALIFPGKTNETDRVSYSPLPILTGGKPNPKLFDISSLVSFKSTERLLVYGQGMRCVSEDSRILAGGKYICKGFTEKYMTMYIGEKGDPLVSDILATSIIHGEVWEVPQSTIEFCMAQGDGRIMETTWVKMTDEGGSVSRSCWIPLYNDITKHYLQNEVELVKNGDWYGFRNRNIQALLRGYGT